MSHRYRIRRIAAAQREGTRQRLISARITPERVDELAAYEALPRFRDDRGTARRRIAGC